LTFSAAPLNSCEFSRELARVFAKFPVARAIMLLASAVTSSGGDNLIGLDYVNDFPNHSRSYDPTRRAVRFWKHDSAIEASFFISEDALKRIQPNARLDESGFLNAFDSRRDSICAAAARI
jgi:hypothetical protein